MCQERFQVSCVKTLMRFLNFQIRYGKRIILQENRITISFLLFSTHQTKFDENHAKVIALKTGVVRFFTIEVFDI